MLGGYLKFTTVNVNQSDIRAIARAELNTIKSMARSAANATADRISKYHLQDIVERIDAILEAKK